MPKKGTTNNPNGRPKGTHNKSTERAKRIMMEFVGKNMDTMQEMYEVIKAEDPKRAFDVLFTATEYCIPKLARTEQRFVDEEGKDRDLIFNIYEEIHSADSKNKEG